MLRSQLSRVVCLVAPLLLVGLSRPVAAQPQTGAVVGTVRSVEGAVLQGAEVVVDGTGRGTHSAPDGAFLITAVPAGRHTITARAIGFGAVSQEIEVVADRSTRLEIALSVRNVQLGTITVLGTRAYGASTSSSALKMDARVLDVPQSVVAISQEFIQDQSAHTLDDLLRDVAGLTPFSDYQDFTARGFREGEDEVTTNGVRSNANNFFTTPNLYNVERVEILKGPSSVLYGSLEGGALVNLVTKHPRAIPAKVYSVTTGSYGSLTGSADLTGPVMGSENFLYRLNGSYGRIGSFRRFQSTRNVGVAPALTWNPRPRTSISILGELTNEQLDGQRNRGIAAPNGDLNALPLSWTANEPTDKASQRAYTGEIDADQGFFSDWKASTTVRYAYSKYNNMYHEPLGLATVGGRVVMKREFRNSTFSWKSLGSTANVGGSVNTGPVQHRLLFGGDLTVKKRLTSPNDYASPVSSLDVFDPQYGKVNLEAYKTMAPADNPFTRDYRDWGVLAQDLITLIPQVKLLVGGRYNDYYVKNANYRLNTYDQQKRKATTYRTGLVYEPVKWASIYGNFSEGFKPQTGANDTKGGPFEPLTTKQIEGGFKLGLFKERLVVTSSTYRIDKLNVLVPDPDPTRVGYLLTLGQVRSQGTEADVVGSITQAWSMTANFAYNDTKVSKDSRAKQVGTRFPGAPRNAAAFWTRYDISGLRLGVAAGASYVDKRNTFDTTILPAYTVFDGAIFYDWNRYKFAVNGKNLTNRRFFSGGYFNYQLYPGSPRTVELTVRAIY